MSVFSGLDLKKLHGQSKLSVSIIKRVSVRRGLTVSSFASISFRFVFLQIPSIVASPSSNSIERFVIFICHPLLPLRFLTSLVVSLALARLYSGLVCTCTV